jgi:hypothetical protein
MRRAGRQRMSGVKKALIVTPVLAVIAGIAWWVYSTHGYAVKVREEMRLFEQEGGSKWLEDLAPMPGQGEVTHYVSLQGWVFAEPNRGSGASRVIVSGAEGAEPQWGEGAAEAYGNFRKWSGFQLAPDTDGREWNEGWRPHLEKYLTVNAQALKNIKEEAEAGDGCFDTDWTQGPATLLPHLTKLRSASRVLSAEAVMRAKAGDAKGALDDARLMLRLRRLVDREPILISQLVAYSMDAMAASTLHGVLDACPADVTAARAIVAELEGREERNSPVRAMLGETATGIYVFDHGGPEMLAQPARGAQRGPGGWVWKAVGTLLWNMPADKYQYLSTMREMRRLARMPVPERMRKPPAPPSTRGGRPRATLTQMLVPPLLRSLTQQASADCKVALVRAALGVEMYRAEKGEFPETLSAVVPQYLEAVPADPYDGKAIRYSAADGGFVVYSIGEDGSDDGGDARKDVVWMKRAQVKAEAPEAPVRK